MARYRTIKPEFWTSEQVMECSPIARLMFIGMWNFADDAGRMPFSPKTIKAQIFPSDDISCEDVRRMLDELSSNDLIMVYAVDGKEYLHITGWRHQRIDRPQEPRYPAPFVECSQSDQRSLPPEENRIERKEEDAAPAAPVVPSDEADFFRRIKQIAGTNAGGLGKRLLQAKGGNIALARAAVEQASTKQDAREYLGAIIRSREEAECRPDRSF